MNGKTYFVVKAIGYSYAKNHDELNLEPRDVLQIIRKLDKYWYLGIKNTQKGKFPSSKVVEVDVQHELRNSIGIYIGLNTFHKEEDGDLAFNKNDIIIATKRIDENWLEGHLLNVPGTGMFPVNSVWKLRENLDEERSNINNRSPIIGLTYATVLHDMEAQLDEELDLKKHDTVIVLSEHDNMYYRGELMNGRKGIFPKSFVSIIKDTNKPSNSSNNRTSSIDQSSKSKRHSTDSQNYEVDNLPTYNEATSWYNNLETDIPSYGRTLYEFKAENSNEISFKENQIVNLIRYVDANWIEIELDNQVGFAPKNYIEIIVDCTNASSFHQDYSTDIEENCEEENNVEIDEFPPDTFGKAIYDFEAQMDGDLSLKTGDVIRMIRKFNNNWVEACKEKSNDLGICPMNHIQILSSYEQANKHFGLFDRSTPPDNLIEFSPEKKDNLNNSNDHNQQQQLNQTPHKVNYDVLHEIENDYELTVFKNASNESKNEPKYELKIDNLNSSNSFTRSDSETNYSSRNNTMNNYDSNSARSTTRPTLSSTNSFTNSNNISMKNSTTNYTSDYSTSRLSNHPPIKPARSIENTFEDSSNKSTYESKKEIDNSSFMNELNKSISNRNTNQKRNLPEKPKRPALPPVPTDRSFNERPSSRNSIKSCTMKASKDEFKSSEIYPNPLKTSLYNKSFENKNYLANDTPSPPTVENTILTTNDSKLTNRLAKMAEQRLCIITELLQSEKDYRNALEVCSRTFLKNEKLSLVFSERNVDLKSIFSNIDEIIAVSEKLNNRLKAEMNKEADSQLIGECFLELEREMSDAYGLYCRNHDDVIPTFERYVQDSEINRLFQRGLDYIRKETNCFDIPSILIKPVQRILKYPLMLNELIKCTPNESRDFEYLQNAVLMITDLATNINEFKRRKDLVCKYRKEAERSNSFSSRLSKLNLHTLKKKYSRFNYKITSSIPGLGNKKGLDNYFDIELSKFRSLEKSIKIFLKNSSLLIEQLDIYVKTTYSLTEEMTTLYGEKCKQRLIEKAKECHYEILDKSINELKNKIEIYINDTLKRLLEKFANPEILIRKRKDKSIDLECSSNRYQSNRDGPKSKQFKDEFTTAKEVYEALNQQLIQDLPMFTSFGTEIFTNCIIAFITFYKKFIGNVVKQMLLLLSLPPIEGSKINCSNDIVDTFQVKHNLIAKKLVEDFHIVPNNIFPQVMNSQTLAVAGIDKHKLMRNSKILNAGSAARPKSGYQTKENRLSILSNSKIAQESIFIVKDNFEPNDVGDLFALKDDIVVVIKKKDPSGHSLRWFVDNGNQKGFLPANILEPKNSQLAFSSNNGFSGFHSSSYNSYPTNNFASSLTSNSISSTSSQANNSMYSNTDHYQHDQWSRSSNIYSEIPEILTANLPNVPNVPVEEIDEITLDDLDPIKQTVYENLNTQVENEADDINLNRKDPPVNEYYRAAYDFIPIGEKQLSLKKDEIVVVKYKCDLHMNDEWYYVESCTTHQRGYVPSAYLVDH